MVDILESTYTSLANVYVIKNNEENGIILGDREELLYEDVKCGVSFKRGNTVTIQDTNAKNRIELKLFMNKKYNIPLNSIIEIRHQNRAYKGRNSGIPSLYDTHQEIVVEIEENA